MPELRPILMAEDNPKDVELTLAALADLALGRLEVDGALSAGLVTMEGDEDAARRLLTSFSGLRGAD